MRNNEGARVTTMRDNEGARPNNLPVMARVAVVLNIFNLRRRAVEAGHKAADFLERGAIKVGHKAIDAGHNTADFLERVSSEHAPCCARAIGSVRHYISSNPDESAAIALGALALVGTVIAVNIQPVQHCLISAIKSIGTLVQHTTSLFAQWSSAHPGLLGFALTAVAISAAVITALVACVSKAQARNKYDNSSRRAATAGILSDQQAAIDEGNGPDFPPA